MSGLREDMSFDDLERRHKEVENGGTLATIGKMCSTPTHRCYCSISKPRISSEVISQGYSSAPAETTIGLHDCCCRTNELIGLHTLVCMRVFMKLVGKYSL